MTNASKLIPMEFNVIVQPDPVQEKVGSIFIPQAKTERDELAIDEGTLVAVSPHAFTYADWPEGTRQPQVGDRVIFGRYTGMLREIDGVKFRILKDKEIVAIVEPAAKLAAAA